MTRTYNGRRWPFWLRCGRCRQTCDSVNCSPTSGSWAKPTSAEGSGYIEDDELLAVLYRHRAELEARNGVRPT